MSSSLPIMTFSTMKNTLACNMISKLSSKNATATRRINAWNSQRRSVSSLSSMLLFNPPTQPRFAAMSTALNSPQALVLHRAAQSPQRTCRRWKQHSAKLGHHRETLEELAHRPEREAAQERRQKKKDRKAAKKSKKGVGGGSGGETANTISPSGSKTVDISLSNKLSEFDDDDDDFLNEEYDDDDGSDNDEDGEGGVEGDDGEPSLPDPDQVKRRMMAIVDRFEESLKSIRGAEPTPEMFDDVQVNAYGSMTPLKAVGQVVIVSNTLAQITCFDPSVAKDVQKAIQLALELNPQSGDEPGLIRVPLPRVSMEVREQTVKQLQKKHEKVKQRIRSVRRKAMDVVKKGKDGKLAGVSKDDAFASGKDVDAVSEQAMEALKVLVDAKVDSIMAV